ncbi:hypothetical protein GHI93_08240 [Lactococcus hircilactis]|uniref:Uncharacterized protein n=1 Tax=Lactococcus hircilactis TaxID=1494462 RepID=A0A7X1Z8R1_9LACT|nr:hypothetical protein [Lactococcus hircilactis]MQW39914.1 hypothetical protein [Lactococcus hircilactis]
MDFNRVDRSDYPSQAIREYHDRGMVKWQGFYLSEHSSAMRQWKNDEKNAVSTDKLTPKEKLNLLAQAWNHQTFLSLLIFSEYQCDEKRGRVRTILNHEECLFEIQKNTFEKIEIKKIIAIKKADSWKTDDDYLETYDDNIIT